MITLHKVTCPIFSHRGTPAASHLRVLPAHLASTRDMKEELIISVSLCLVSKLNMPGAGLIVLLMSQYHILKQNISKDFSNFLFCLISFVYSTQNHKLLNVVHIHSHGLNAFWFSHQTLLMIYRGNCSVLTIFSFLSILSLERASMHF